MACGALGEGYVKFRWALRMRKADERMIGRLDQSVHFENTILNLFPPSFSALLYHMKIPSEIYKRSEMCYLKTHALSIDNRQSRFHSNHELMINYSCKHCRSLVSFLFFFHTYVEKEFSFFFFSTFILNYVQQSDFRMNFWMSIRH